MMSYPQVLHKMVRDLFEKYMSGILQYLTEILSLSRIPLSYSYF
jgi:hypothetical protein